MRSAANSCETVPDRILRRAAQAQERNAVIFLERGEAISAQLNYASLVEEVGRLASRLTAEGLANKPVMISLPAGIEFVTLFLACLWARVIVIPAPYPANARLFSRLHALVADARPCALVTDKSGMARLAAQPWEGAPPRMLNASALRDGALSVAEPMRGDGDQPAMIQYTSGSTSAPRGIVITHANLFANQLMIQAAYENDESFVGVNWVPHFHDMGLLGVILQPLFAGGLTILMDPLAFVQKPIRWLRAIDRFRAMTAGGPCFGYDLCVRRCAPADIAQLDLSAWRVAFCGAEPVRRPVLDAFSQMCGPAGFSERAFSPCYGLAEATLIVSAAPLGKGAREVYPSQTGVGDARRTHPAVSCGPPTPGGRVLIRAENGIPAPAGAIGEIWVAGPHVSPGVWSSADGRVTPFSGEFVDDSGDRFVSTGDIGVIVDGELAPLDRLKDVIILYGQKLHAADVEATLLSRAPSLEILAACAFSADRGKDEQLIVLCEMDRKRFRAGDTSETIQQLTKLVAEAHGVLPLLQIFPYGSLPRTSSGKIQRSQSKSDWLEGRIEAAAAPENASG